MSKITISRLLDTARALKTDSGKELSDLINYLQNFCEQTLRALRGGLTFQNNFNSDVSRVTLEHNTEQVVNKQNDRALFAVIPLRVISTSIGFDSFIYYEDSSGNLVVKAGFTGSPSDEQACDLLLLYV